MPDYRDSWNRYVEGEISLADLRREIGSHVRGIRYRNNEGRPSCTVDIVGETGQLERVSLNVQFQKGKKADRVREAVLGLYGNASQNNPSHRSEMHLGEGLSTKHYNGNFRSIRSG